MTEQGFVALVQKNADVAVIAAAGGFLAELPKDQALPSWTYQVVSDPATYTLGGNETGFTRIQVDVFGSTAAETIHLAKAIDKLLSGYSGPMPDDPDQGAIDSCLRSGKMDFFNDATRNYRRMLEYEIWFLQ